MPDTKRPLKVFLCHAHADRDPVRGLYTRLTQDGVDAWLDKAKLLPGQDWELEIRKAVREADVVVVCLSKQFNQAGFRQKEVRWALDTAMEKPEGDIFIIPARLEECDNLESLRKWHWVNLFEEDGYQNLISALRRRAEVIGVEINVDGNKKVDQSNSAETKKIKPRRQLEIVLMLVGIVVVIAIAISYLSPNLLSISISLTPTPTFTASPTRAVLSPVITPNSTALPTEITDAKGVSMVLVPAGGFTMGSTNGNNDEKPAHVVYLNKFYIDKFEVTNALYRVCVEDGACEALTKSMRFTLAQYDQHPVAFVKWDQARNYCEWRGGHLPTEAEWEKAARGINNLTYPWGDGFDCDRVNLATCIGDTLTVGSYEGGKSPYGLYDMAGNVWEWVEDWYSEVYYTDSRVDNPTGADSGRMRVIRGGAWDSSYLDIRTYTRDGAYPSGVKNNIGFRCARDSNP